MYTHALTGRRNTVWLTGSLLIYHGHFKRERGLLSFCRLWDIWSIFLSLGVYLNCQALRVVKVHRKRVEELDTSKMVLRVNLRRLHETQSRLDASAAPQSPRERVQEWAARNPHKLEFYRDLVLWMLPWAIVATVATADRATCFDVYVGGCSYRKQRYPFIFICLSLLPMLRTLLLGYELRRLGTKASFIEYALLRRGMILILAAMVVWTLLSYLRNYTPLSSNRPYRIYYRLAKTGVMYAVILYWQHELIGRQVWRLLVDPKGENERVAQAVKGGIGLRRRRAAPRDAPPAQQRPGRPSDPPAPRTRIRSYAYSFSWSFVDFVVAQGNADDLFASKFAGTIWISFVCCVGWFLMGLVLLVLSKLKERLGVGGEMV